MINTKKIFLHLALWESNILAWIPLSLMIFVNLPEKVSKRYNGEKIIYRSWHDIVRVFVWVMIAIAVISLVWLTVLKIKEMKIQEKKTVGKVVVNVSKLILLWGLILISLFMMSLFLFLRFTLRYDGDMYYEYTDGNHTIVIEETSFLLSGDFSVYQINEDNTAVGIGGALTDDGYRNYGEYEMEWTDEYVKITFCNGIRSDSFETIECKFK